MWIFGKKEKEMIGLDTITVDELKEKNKRIAAAFEEHLEKHARGYFVDKCWTRDEDGYTVKEWAVKREYVSESWRGVPRLETSVHHYFRTKAEAEQYVRDQECS